MALDVLNVVQLVGQRIVDIDDNDLPVGLALVKQSHDSEDLHLLDLASVTNELSNLAYVERVVVTLGLGLGVSGIGVFPGLHSLFSTSPVKMIRQICSSYLGESTVVPDITLVGEAVADESKLALLDVLLDGVEELLLGDL